MSHIFFIDPLSKLNIKKDSSLMMALKFKEYGHQVYLLFEKDFYIQTQGEQAMTLYEFEGELKADGFYIESFTLGHESKLLLSADDIIHMRIDPPFDSRYQRYLWMLDFLMVKSQVQVVNSPHGIMFNNEKLVAFKRPLSIPSFIGSSWQGAFEFLEKLKLENVSDIILKPLDLYSGIGVQKLSISNSHLKDIFEKNVIEYEGAIIIQPFMERVYEGEWRSIYFDGVELGTILKKPNKGEFLANIAQGAKFEKAILPDFLQNECAQIASLLGNEGVRFIAFDILGDSVTEVNVTCPGLLVEVSFAMGINLAALIATKFTLTK